MTSFVSQAKLKQCPTQALCTNQQCHFHQERPQMQPPKNKSFCADCEQEPQLYAGTREIWLHDITDESALYFHERAMQSIQQEPDRPIVVLINSAGGEGSALFKILDTMDVIRDMTPNEQVFITCAVGKAMSAGAIILAYGDLRCATPRSMIMLHQAIALPNGGPIQDVESEVREIKESNKQMLKIIQEKCNPAMSMKVLKEKLARNLFLTPKQALEFGIIDVIGYPKVDSEVIYDIYILNNPESVAARKKERAEREIAAEAAHEAAKKAGECTCTESCEECP